MLFFHVFSCAHSAPNLHGCLLLPHVFSLSISLCIYLLSITSYLSINYPICRYVLKLKRREFKAVVLMTSQKTLPVSVTVISFLSAVGEEGLMTIPCIVGHMSQLFIDAYISSRWANDPSEDPAEPGGQGGAVVGGTLPPSGKLVGGQGDAVNGVSV